MRVMLLALLLCSLSVVYADKCHGNVGNTYSSYEKCLDECDSYADGDCQCHEVDSTYICR